MIVSERVVQRHRRYISRNFGGGDVEFSNPIYDRDFDEAFGRCQEQIERRVMRRMERQQQR